MLTSKKRPLGITALGVLSEIFGVIFIFSGIASALAGITIPLFLREEVILANEMVTGIPIELAGMMVTLMGFGFTGFGVFTLIVGIGLMKGKKWAWTLEVISTFISLVIGVFYLIGDDLSSGIFYLILSGIILYYLYRPNIKAYFGKNTIHEENKKDVEVNFDK